MQQVDTMRKGEEELPEEAPRLRPVRTCVGCRKPDDAESLVRLVLGPADAGLGPAGAGLGPGDPSGAPIAVDMADGKQGRGAHVHARPECLASAAGGGIARSFKTKVATSAKELAAQISDGADRRIAGLLGGAWRGKLLAVGADAASSALDRGAPCLVVASDAGTVIERGAFAAAIAEGKAIAWKDKRALGALVGGRDEVAVCAVLNESMAAEIVKMRRLGEAALGRSVNGAGGTACRSREVR